MRSVCCLAVLVVVTAIQTADGAILTFTNRADWESAVSGITTVTFDAEPTGEIYPRDFGPFTATASDSAIHFTVTNSASAEMINDTQYLSMWSFNEAHSMNWSFDSPISALGFEWRNTDESGDQLEVQIDGFQHTLVPPPTTATRFFGVIKTDGTFSNVSFSDTAGGNGTLYAASFDNVSFGASSISAVPEPASLTMFGLGAIGFGICAVRRRRREG